MNGCLFSLDEYRWLDARDNDRTEWLCHLKCRLRAHAIGPPGHCGGDRCVSGGETGGLTPARRYLGGSHAAVGGNARPARLCTGIAACDCNRKFSRLPHRYTRRRRIHRSLKRRRRFGREYDVEWPRLRRDLLGPSRYPRESIERRYDLRRPSDPATM